MNDDHDIGHAHDPDGAAEGVQDLVAGRAAQGIVAGVGDTKVAVGHQSVGNVHPCSAESVGLTGRAVVAEQARWTQRGW